MQFTVIGNSLARGIVIEGFEVECRLRARLRELLERARERAGANRLIVIIFGILDLRDEGIVRLVREVREEEGIVLCPFYPPRGGGAARKLGERRSGTSTLERLTAEMVMGPPNWWPISFTAKMARWS